MKDSERDFLFKQMKYVSCDGIVVEVGSYLGDSSSRAISEGLIKYNKNAKFYCVDTFVESFFENQPELMAKHKKKYGDKKVYDIFVENMKNYRHEVVLKDSIEAAKDFKNESVDFVFIDAVHTYESVVEDIKAWFPKVKIGGMICGHDYGKKQFGVTRAVNEFFKDVGCKSSIWNTKKQ